MTQEKVVNGIAGARDSYVPFRGHRTWTRTIGQGETGGRLPLLLIHGGPGLPSDYLEPLHALARGRRVIIYDQLGCGRSDQPDDPSLWSIDLFLEELSVVRRALGLDHVHILGHSWGGMLALEHALTGAPGIASLVAANAMASVPEFRIAVRTLVDALPLEQRDALRRGLDAGDLTDPLTQQAIAEFDARHLTRLNPLPECLQRSIRLALENTQVYHTLWGQHELDPSGRLRTWDVRHRLGEITIPTLVLGGRHDEMTPEITADLHRRIADSEYVLFEESGHTPHLEESDLFVRVVDDFLGRVEAYL